VDVGEGKEDEEKEKEVWETEVFIVLEVSLPPDDPMG
jgi:hypothetical protein